MAKYVIEHTMVGPGHFKGEIVEFGEDAKKAGVDVERLLKLGAIRKPTDDDKGEPVTYGQGNADTPRTFPAVPFQVLETVGEVPPPELTTGAGNVSPAVKTQLKEK